MADDCLNAPTMAANALPRDAADAAKMSSFVEHAVRAGATGVGAGLGYMGPSTVHIGGGTSATWGGAPWIAGAHAGGMAGRAGRRSALDTPMKVAAIERSNPLSPPPFIEEVEPHTREDFIKKYNREPQSDQELERIYGPDEPSNFNPVIPPNIG
jgi:hypothetical protein